MEVRTRVRAHLNLDVRGACDQKKVATHTLAIGETDRLNAFGSSVLPVKRSKMPANVAHALNGCIKSPNLILLLLQGFHHKNKA